MEVQVFFEAEKFWGKWLRSLKKCKTLYDDSWEYGGQRLILPFRNRKYTTTTRKTYRNILDWCIENGIEVYEIDYSYIDNPKVVNALEIIFNF